MAKRVRLVTALFLLSIFVSGSLVGVTPQKTEAQVSGIGGIIASCAGLSGLVQGAISSVIGYVPVNDSQNNGKECMDAVAYALAKTVLAQLTNSIINWINTGFQGNPFYLTNSTQFFQDIAGGQARLVLSQIQATGNVFFDSIRAQTIGRFRYGFQNRFGSTFNQDARQALCRDENNQSEFYVEIVRTPRRSIEGPFQTYAECNARRGAAQNEQGVIEVGFCTQTSYSICASNLDDNEWSQAYGSRGFIDAFTSGQIPFRWDLFNSLTQNCGNNPFCSRYAAQNAIENQIASRGNQIAQELNRSGGFLGQQRCVDPGYEDRLADWESQLSDPTNANNPEVIAAIGYRPECPGYVTETPGRVIADKLTGSLGTSERQLELADEINESLAAIFDALIAKLIDEGLSAFTGSGNDDYYNYLNDPRSGFGFGTTFDQVNNDEDCTDLGGRYNFITNTCEFEDEGNNQLPDFPWFIDGVPYTSIEEVAGAFPGRCIVIDGIQLIPGTQPCVEGVSSEDNGGGNVDDYRGTLILSSSSGPAGVPITIEIRNAKPNAPAEIAQSEGLIGIGTTNTSGYFSISFTPTGNSRTLTIYGEVEDTIISPLQFTVTGSVGSGPPATTTPIVTWYDVSGVGNYGESCDLWLTRTGQKRNVTQGYMNDRRVSETLSMFGGCAYESGSFCGVGSIFASSTQHQLRPVASCDVNNQSSNISVKTQVASTTATVSMYPLLENNWRYAIGEGALGESCVSWLTRTGQMTSGTLFRTVSLDRIVTELNRCLYKRDSQEEYGRWDIITSHPLFKPVAQSTAVDVLRLQLK